MPDPLVSAIIIVYNGEAFLEEAIDSILAQDYPNVEAIVIDDGSTDRSGEIARSKPVRYIRQENQGEVTARNAGLDAANGELIAWLDADDVWLPNKLSLQVACLEEHPEAGFALGWAQDFLEDGAVPPAWFKPEWLDEPSQAWIPSLWLVRRELFDTIGRFDPDFGGSPDVDWLARARFSGTKFEVLPDLLARRRIHGNNLIYRPDAPRSLFKVLRANAARHKAKEDDAA